MAATTTRELYLEIGLTVLADSGYGALKLAEVCKRLGVTSGSFYHFFENWSDYTTQLIDHWLTSRTEAEVAAVQAEPDPLRRLTELIEFAISLPHEAEAAIRTWAAMDPAIREVQQAADRARYDVVFDLVVELLDDRAAAHRYSSWANYVLTGYEQTTLPEDREALRWAAEQFIASLESEARDRRAEQAVAVDRLPETAVDARD